MANSSGLHNGSKQVSTTRRAEHEAISLELMDRIDEWTGFTDGDLEYFVAGTESHVEESEERIARDRDAQAYIPSDVAGGRDGVYVLRLDHALMVKRVSLPPRRGKAELTISSDNPHYPSWPDVDHALVDIVGRVVWSCRRLV